MTQLWLVGMDEPSYQATVATPIDLSDREDKPVEFPDFTRVWGVRTDRERERWDGEGPDLERLERGDRLLCYRNGTGRYVATGRVGPFWHTDHVRDAYWEGGPPVDVFAIEGYAEVDVEPERVHRILDYEASYWPQGLRPVEEDRSVERLRRRLKLPF